MTNLGRTRLCQTITPTLPNLGNLEFWSILPGSGQGIHVSWNSYQPAYFKDQYHQSLSVIHHWNRQLKPKSCSGSGRHAFLGIMKEFIKRKSISGVIYNYVIFVIQKSIWQYGKGSNFFLKIWKIPYSRRGGQQGSFSTFHFFPNGLKINFKHWNFLHL